jgi:hypothetical protein
MESEERRCRVNSQGNLKQVGWPWELLSKFGYPWADFASFRGKALGSRMRRFASESPGNDQFSLDGSFAIPRDFLNGIHFDRLLEGKPLGQELTGFALESPWNDQIFINSAGQIGL